METGSRTALLALAVLASGCRAILGIEDGVVAGDGGSSGDGASGDGSSPVGYRKQITVGSPVNVALDGFTIPIIRGADPDLAMHARTDGKDLHFTSGGAELPFELVGYSPITGALEAWVRVPSLTQTTQLYLEYGRMPTQPAGNAWQGAEGVWHLADSLFGLGGYADSSPRGRAASTFAPPTSATGVAGAAVNMTPSTVLTVGDPADGSLDFTGSFSVSLWVRVTSTMGMYDRPFTKGGSTIADPGYDIELGAANWNVVLSDTATVIPAKFGTEAQLLGRWVQLAASIDRTAATLTAYTDGVLSETVSLGQNFGSIASDRPLAFGNTMYAFRGLLDEVRIYGSAKSREWFFAEYALLTTPSISVGPEEQVD